MQGLVMHAKKFQREQRQFSMTCKPAVLSKQNEFFFFLKRMVCLLANGVLGFGQTSVEPI
jgi:hypothetical protein